MTPSFLTNNTGNTTYYGIYKGMVIDTNAEMGVVKVFIPEIYGYNINRVAVEKKDSKIGFSYKFPGRNIKSDIDSNTLKEIKNLPWARISSPIIGESSPGRYFSEIDGATVGDGTNPLKLFKDGEVQTGKAACFKTHPPTGRSGLEHMLPKRNPFAWMVQPENLDNLPKGSFSIPTIGAHVWVMFVRGNHNLPVVLGAAHGSLEYSQIYYKNEP